jgi:large subunit ribosomal protein L9
MSATKTRIRAEKRLPTTTGGNVQLLLIQSVDNLGKQGDVVAVRPGYARNYLLPQGLAAVASDHHKRMVEKHRVKLLEIEQARLKTLRDLANLIGQQSITIEANANEEGHLYGSVGTPEIVAALRANGVAITADQIKLDGVLKELGLYTVRVQFHPEISTDVKVWVVPAASN